jgi:putative tricarboxylic transport membrane protein
MEGLIWLLLGAGFCAGSFKLKIGTLQNPGAGFIPFLVGTLLIGFGLIMFLSTRWGPWARSERKETGNSGTRSFKDFFIPSATLLILLGYVLLLESLGFLLSSVIFLFLLFKISDPRKWLLPIALSVTTVIISYLLFSVWLKGQFPRGILGF